LFNSLKQFVTISWNLSGLNVEDIGTFITDVSMESFWSVLCIQELGPQTSFELHETANGHIYIFPGISKHSRSNAIAVSHLLSQHIAFHEYCSYGGLVVFKFADHVIVVVSLHIPYASHEIPFDQATEDVDAMFERLSKHVRKNWNLHKRNIHIIGGGDFNCNLSTFGSISTRRTDMQQWLLGHNLNVIEPESEQVISHLAWGTGTHKLLDFIVSSNSVSGFCSPMTEARDLSHLAHSDHRPMKSVCNLAGFCHEPHCMPGQSSSDVSEKGAGGITRHKELMFGISPANLLQGSSSGNNGSSTSKTRNYHKLHKDWKPDENELAAYHSNLDELCSHVHSLGDVDKALTVAGSHVKNKSSHYRDSSQLKVLCALRSAEDDPDMRAYISLEINKLRKQERQAFKTYHTIQLANMKWHSLRTLQQTNRSSEIRKLPASLSSPLLSMSENSQIQKYQWGPLFCNFWISIHMICATKLALERKHLDLLKQQISSTLVCQTLDGTYVDLITHSTIEIALAKLKTGKALDSSGVCNEALSNCSYNFIAKIQELFNHRANGKLESSDSWRNVNNLLFPKHANVKSVTEFRPIAIMSIVHKLYLRCLLVLLQPFLLMQGFIQHGCRRYHQGAEVVHTLRIIIEKSLEWGFGVVFVSLDIKKAFDTVLLEAVEELFINNSVPARVAFALLQELYDERKSSFSVFGNKTEYINMNRGLRQGSPEASILFSAIVNMVLTKLCDKWKL
jgi:hypothetical protein